MKHRPVSTASLLLALLIAATGLPAIAGTHSGSAAAITRIRPDGDAVLVRYAGDGTELHRYTGFSDVTALALHDPSTVLVAERSGDRITALRLEGTIAWTIPVRRPRCVRPLAEERLLVCQDDPPALIEIGPDGEVGWRLPDPPTDISGAALLPDGNVAVAVGRHPGAGVHVYRRDGERIWSWPQGVAQPQGLALLPSGEIAVSGPNPGDLVLFRPLTAESRTLQFCCHPYSVSTTEDGRLLAAGWLVQRVRGWGRDGKMAFDFKTRYPATAALGLSDGSVLVALFLEPDTQCLKAAAARTRAARPLARYWVWLFTALGAGIFGVVVVQHRTLWLYTFGRRRAGTTAPGEENPVALTVRRRLEIGLYAVTAIAFAAAAAFHHSRLLATGEVRLWPYAALAGAGGVLLALAQYRVPPQAAEWPRRMASLQPMSWPTLPMWTLWLAAIALLAFGVKSVLAQHEAAALMAWVGAVVLLAGGSIQVPPPPTRRSALGVAGSALLFAALLFIRVYRLEDYPANLHNDMAEWTKHVIRLIDGDVETMFAHGFAEIPLAGHVWSALWTVVAGRSLAGARFASVAGSLLALWGVYLLTRRLYGSWTAVAATALLGTNHAFLHFSRIQHYMDPIPFHVLAVLGLLAGMESGRYGWFALAGLAGGYSALTYHAGRITPLVLALLTGLLVLRYPRSLLKRWPGLLLMAIALFAMLEPYAVLFATGRLYAFGRSEVYPFLINQKVDSQALLDTLASGVPRAFGALWFFHDTSVQYGSPLPVFFPATGALVALTAVAAVLRPADIRGLLIVLWTSSVLVIGGALTINPPFWPRIVTAFVPAAIAAAAALVWLARGARIPLGRPGRLVALAGIAGFLLFNASAELRYLANYYRGIRPGQATPSQSNQWVESLMGRDIQKWGAGAMIYIVSENPREHSCDRATMQYYVLGADVQNARDIARYMPFDDPRTIVLYFAPDSYADAEIVRRRYPDAERKEFRDNLGNPVFTRLVVRAPHS